VDIEDTDFGYPEAEERKYVPKQNVQKPQKVQPKAWSSKPAERSQAQASRNTRTRYRDQRASFADKPEKEDLRDVLK